MNNKTKRGIATFLASAAVFTTGCTTLEAHAEDALQSGNTSINGVITTETIYYIKEGDTLGSIALKYFGNANYAQDLAIYNNISNVDMIYAGDVIYIPATLNDLFAVSRNEEKKEYAAPEEYVIQSGDNLTKICNAYYGNSNIKTIWRLATYNNLASPSLIYAGNKLLIPSKEELDNIIPYDYSAALEAEKNVEDTLYTVVHFDTVTRICNKFYGISDRDTVWKFSTYNNLDDQNMIYEGQVLRIPSYDVLKTVVSRDYSATERVYDETLPPHHHCWPIIPDNGYPFDILDPRLRPYWDPCFKTEDPCMKPPVLEKK